MAEPQEGLTCDLLTAGFPCQDLSVAGRRAGLKGERSGLFWEIVRIADELDVPHLLLENVPGLLSSHGGRDLALVLGALVGTSVDVPAGGWRGAGVVCGPTGVATWRILDAQFFGVPQRRRRWFCFVERHPRTVRGPEILLEPEGVSGDSPTGREAGEGVARPLGAGTPTSRRDDLDHGAIVTTQTLRVGGREEGAGSSSDNTPVVAFDTTQITSKANRSQPKPGDPSHPLASGAHPPSIAHTLSSEGADAGEDGTGRGTPIVAHTLRENWRNNSNPASDPLVFQPKASAHQSMNPSVLSPSLGTTKEPAITTTIPRRLTPIECERLQDFPDGWTAVNGAKDSPRYRALGNAVAVACVRWIVRRIRQCIPEIETVGELFAGIGGFGLAAELEGLRVVWASEIDPFARQVYAHHFPHVELLGDIRAIGYRRG